VVAKHTDARMETTSAFPTRMEKLLEALHVVFIHIPSLTETRNALGYDVRGLEQSLQTNWLMSDNCEPYLRGF
jgi:hypothetical protein